METYSIHNERKSVAAERFIRTLRNRIYKYIISISKNQVIQLTNTTTQYSTIKLKPVDVKSSTYINYKKKNNKEGPKFKVGDNVRISKYKIFLQKAMFQIGLKKIQKLKILFPGHMLLVILKLKKLLELFSKKNCKEQIKKNLELKK